MTNRETMWQAVSLGAGVGAAMAARKSMAAVWRVTTRRGDGPPDPADPSTSWPEALGWVVVLSIGAGVARLVAQRAAFAAWEVATHAPPPGFGEAAGDDG